MTEERQPERPRRGSPERYPGNSHTEKAAGEAKRMQSVKLQGKAEIQPPLSRRIRESITGDDARTIGDYLLFEIVIPNFKSLVVDAGNEALERMFFPSGGRSRSRRSSNGSSFSGGGLSQRQPRRSGARDHDVPFDREERRPLSSRARNQYRFDDIYLSTRGDAEGILEAMRDAIDHFGSVSVAEVLDELGYGDDKNWMMDDWGWTDLGDARAVRVSADRYRLDIPDAVKLDKR